MCGDIMMLTVPKVFIFSHKHFAWHDVAYLQFTSSVILVCGLKSGSVQDHFCYKVIY